MLLCTQPRTDITRPQCTFGNRSGCDPLHVAALASSSVARARRRSLIVICKVYGRDMRSSGMVAGTLGWQSSRPTNKTTRMIQAQNCGAVPGWNLLSLARAGQAVGAACKASWRCNIDFRARPRGRRRDKRICLIGAANTISRASRWAQAFNLGCHRPGPPLGQARGLASEERTP
jgi:hypothetical protein